MTNINKTIEEFNEYWRLYASINNIKGQCNFNNFRDNIKSHLFYSIKEALKAQEQEHQKVTDFLIESHAFDMKELKKKHQKKLKEINEFGGDETDAYNLIDKLNEEK